MKNPSPFIPCTTGSEMFACKILLNDSLLVRLHGKNKTEQKKTPNKQNHQLTTKNLTTIPSHAENYLTTGLQKSSHYFKDI